MDIIFCIFTVIATAVFAYEKRRNIFLHMRMDYTLYSVEYFRGCSFLTKYVREGRIKNVPDELLDLLLEIEVKANTIKDYLKGDNKAHPEYPADKMNEGMGFFMAVIFFPMFPLAVVFRHQPGIIPSITIVICLIIYITIISYKSKTFEKKLKERSEADHHKGWELYDSIKKITKMVDENDRLEDLGKEPIMSKYEECKKIEEALPQIERCARAYNNSLEHQIFAVSPYQEKYSYCFYISFAAVVLLITYISVISS